MGSLVAATASYLEARSRSGEWLVRMEDLDPPRCRVEAADEILRALHAYGFVWDGPVLYQSTRNAAYQATLEALSAWSYPCGCSRQDECRCRSGLTAGRPARAIKIRAPEDIGDFVIRRADGLYAYQLAVVVDDAAQGVTDVVRGADLLDSTPRQMFLHRCLGLPIPGYVHVPLVLDASGDKLSKQTMAPALPLDDPAPLLRRALTFLTHPPPPDFSLAELWAWAIPHWDLRRLTYGTRDTSGLC